MDQPKENPMSTAVHIPTAEQTAYFADDAQLFAAAAALLRERNPMHRCGLLRILADIERRRATLHPAAFDDGDGYAEVLADSARLLALQSEEEYCRTETGPSDWYLTWLDDRAEELRQVAAWAVLKVGLRRHRREFAHRRLLLAAACRAWADTTPGGAVESVWCAGMPWGRSGPPRLDGRRRGHR